MKLFQKRSITKRNQCKKYTYDKCIEDFLLNKKDIKKGTLMRSFICLDRSKSNG